MNIQIGLDWIGSVKMDQCPTLGPIACSGLVYLFDIKI